jgi:mRNA-degrading endonuclease RelE of RelBE toxin-antitoxin system
VYRVKYSPRALKSLRRLPRKVAKAIVAELSVIAEDPRAPHAGMRPLRRNLKGKSRLHWAGFRAIFEAQHARSVLFVYDALPRGRAYD